MTHSSENTQHQTDDRSAGSLPRPSGSLFATGFPGGFASLFAAWMIPWSIVNLLTLTRFPHAHSDEAWLAGLSAAIWESGSLRTTEPFFDLFPRQPHLMKALYHLLQGVLVNGSGFTLFLARLPSLVAAIATLLVLYRGVSRHYGQTGFPLLVCITLSLNASFLHAAHFGRQESLMLLALVLAQLIYERTLSSRTFWVVPLWIGLSATLHPNAFLVAAIIGFRLLADWLSGRARLRHALIYGGVLTLCALGLLGGSLLLNPTFLADYSRFGASLSVDAPATDRMMNFLAYFQKLAGQITGTYWIPNLRFLFLLAGLGLPIGGFLLVTVRGNRPRTDPASWAKDSAASDRIRAALAETAGFLAGLFVLGRFNPTAIVFVLPSLVSLIAACLHQGLRAPRPVRKATLALGWAILLGSLLMSLWDIQPFLIGNSTAAPGTMAGSVQSATRGSRIWDNPEYEAYLNSIRGSLEPDAVVLGNLSAGFAFSGIPFHDIRNLADAGGTRPNPAEYCRERGINTIFWYEEYAYILRNPQWRILYETEPDSSRPSQALSPHPSFLADLKQFLDEEGTLVSQFDAPVYGTRIMRYMGEGSWTVYVYRLDHGVRLSPTQETPISISQTRHSP